MLILCLSKVSLIFLQICFQFGKKASIGRSGKRLNNRIHYMPVYFPVETHADWHAQFRLDRLKFHIPPGENTRLWRRTVRRLLSARLIPVFESALRSKIYRKPELFRKKLILWHNVMYRKPSVKYRLVRYRFFHATCSAIQTLFIAPAT